MIHKLYFFKSGIGKTVLLVILCLTIFYFINGCRKRSGKGTVELPKLPKIPFIGSSAEKPTDMGKGVHVQKRESYSPYRPTKPIVAVEPKQAVTLPEVPDLQEVEAFEPQPALVHFYQPVQPKPIKTKIVKHEPTQTIPMGTMIRCRLVTTVASGTQDLPIIAKVMKTVRSNGKVLIPYGSEIHGSIDKDHRGNRVTTKTLWRVVLPSGKSLNMTGTGLNRDYNLRTKRYGMDDGSLGIKGEMIRSGVKRDSKKILAKGLSAMSRFAQKRGRTILGEEVLTTARNGALEGAATVVDDYAGNLEKEANKDKPFVRALAGTEFYIYVTNEITNAPTYAPNDLNNALQQREELMNVLRKKLEK